MPMSMQSTRMEQHHHHLGYTNGAAVSPVGAGMQSLPDLSRRYLAESDGDTIPCMTACVAENSCMFRFATPFQAFACSELHTVDGCRIVGVACCSMMCPNVNECRHERVYAMVTQAATDLAHHTHRHTPPSL